MNMAAGAFAIGAALRLLVAQSPSLVTVAQRDEWRSSVDGPSAAVSGDGRYIAFTSYAQLVPADTNRNRDVYVLDRLNGKVTLESVAADGRASSVDSAHPHISRDGRFLVYETLALPSGRCDVVLRDRVEQSVRIVTGRAANASAEGWSRDPAISADGAVVAFVSSAHLVHGHNVKVEGSDVYAFEVRSGAIRRVSVDTAGLRPSFGAAVNPVLSADGRYVAFASTAPLAPAAADRPRIAPQRRPRSHVYVRDTHAHATRLVGFGPAGRLPAGDSWSAAISGDGRYVAFVSAAANLVAGDRNRSADVFVADLRTGAIDLVSRSAKGGSANGPSDGPSLSADGRFVAFESEASDLVCAKDCRSDEEDINLLWDVFLFDRQTGVMTRVSADATGGWMEASSGAAVDAAGDVVAFTSRHPIDAADNRNDFDLFVHAVMPHRNVRR
jgi:Tol biopolymer transport system component